MSDNIRLAEKVMKQKAVYWGFERFDENGRPVYDDPIEIKCRWEDRSEQYIGDDGQDHVSNSIVVVDRDLLVQGVIWLGELEDVNSESNPMDNKGAYEIKKNRKIPDRKGTKFYREVVL